MEDDKFKELMDSVNGLKQYLDENMQKKQDLVDTDSEIVNLWFEFIYLRSVLSMMMDKNNFIRLTDEELKFCKDTSIEHVKNKFSNLNIGLRDSNYMNPNAENKPESTSCTP